MQKLLTFYIHGIKSKEYTNASQKQELYTYSMNKQYVEGVQNSKRNAC